MAKIHWDKLINEYKEQPREYPMEYGDWAEPYSEQLAHVYEKGKIINTPATDDIIHQVESKLNIKLPPSYVEFLEYSNGLLLLDRFTNILPLENIDWFDTLNREWVESWSDDEDDISDEKYFIYGKEQDSCWMRNRYLKTALQISDSTEGDVLLLNPEVKFGEEWEAWWFSNAHPGAVRFKSFKELLEYLLFPSEESEPRTDDECALMQENNKEPLKNMEQSVLGGLVSSMISKGLNDTGIASEFEKELAATQAIMKENSNSIDHDSEGKDGITEEGNGMNLMKKIQEIIAKKS